MSGGPGGICGEHCLERARADLKIAHKWHLVREVISVYRSERKSGLCPCRAMWCGCYEWDI